MNKRLSQHRNKLTALISMTFLLTPLFSLWGTVFFGLIQWQEVLAVLQFGLLPTFLTGMLAWVVMYFWHFLDPVVHQLERDPESYGQKNNRLAITLHKRLQRFNLSYWGLFVLFSISMPIIYIYSLNNIGIGYDSSFIGMFFSLQLTISILIAMPAYLFAQDTISKLAELTGLLRTQNSIHSKLLLLAGFLPILTYTLLLEYYWLNTGAIEPATLFIWGVLTAITMLVTFLSARSLRHSLDAVQSALHSSGAVTNESLASLKPQSTDEIGFLAQTLGRVFQRLNDQETHIRAIIDNAAEGIIVTGNTGLIDTFNKAAQDLFNYSSAEVRGKPLSWIIQDMLEKDGSPKHLSGRYKVQGIKRDNSHVSVSVCVSGVLLSSKPVFIYLVDDISDTEAALEKMQKAEAMYRDLVETAHDLVWSMNTQGEWIYLNNASGKLYGYTPKEMIGRNVKEFQHPDFAIQEQEAFEKISQGHELYQFETTHIDRHGKAIHLSLNARSKTDSDGNIIRITGTARDITATKEYQRQLSYQAEHDALTGLYNRRLFQQELDRVMARNTRSASTSGLLYIDLDQFKYINDTLGHAAGDRLLIEISNMLTVNAREGDLLARFGGDEFTLLLYNIEVQNLEVIAENFRQLFDDFKFYNKGNGFSISCSIGATIIDNTTHNSEEAMSHADLACNIAKTRGRNCVNIYRPEDRDEEGMADDMGWAARVNDMIDRDRFILAYQPVVEIKTKKILNYELLLRMPADDGKVILPGGFMPAAERFGLIHKLDSWMIKASFKKLNELATQGIREKFSINLSDRAHEDANLLTLIKDQLTEYNINPEDITFEIGETAVITNLTAATEFISSLKELGCQCALDDFGSGFCSFGYLKDLPVDIIKIDGSVIQGIVTNPVDRALVQSMNTMAHAMGKVTIAECVETEEILNSLIELGVDFVQGHHLGKPIQKPEYINSETSVQQSCLQ
ncbi:MAG: EAL domain-containing protein [Gammaproteobacteria bacterium]|nr:EAL domain-containing protein [Gammaproteobacteria bacterium]